MPHSTRIVLALALLGLLAAGPAAPRSDQDLNVR
jgi:hypothetical protein